MKRKYKINEDVFKEVNEASAYWIGFLMADGCVTQTGTVKIALNSKDRNHLEKFKNFLQSEHPIKQITVTPFKDKTRVFEHSSFSANSKKIVKDLNSFGVVPAKSLTAKAIKLEMDRHFWRGVIDGDGSVLISKRGDVSISLIGSHEIVSQFARFTKTIIHSKAKINTRFNNAYITFSSRNAYKIISYLYKDCSVYLDRKFQKYLEVKEIYNSIDEKQDDLNELTAKIAILYKQGVSALKIAKDVGISSQTVYSHLARHKKITGETIDRHYQPRNGLSSSQKYRLKGKCKDCGKDTAPNRSRCEFHLSKARDQARAQWSKRKTILTSTIQ